MAEPLVAADQLSKEYHLGAVGVSAIRALDLSIAPGDFIAVMGPSGCGKTTLLNCLSGLDDPTGGTVRIDGQDIHALDDNARTDYRAQHMGFVFQHDHLLPVLSAEENVELPLLLLGIGPAEARRRAQDMLGRVGLGDRLRHKPSELSGGQRQRVSIARALINNPKIVWADEPTGDLDDSTTGEIMMLFKALNEGGGQTFVLVTHDVELAKGAKRIVRMHDGHIVEDKPQAEARHA